MSDEPTEPPKCPTEVLALMWRALSLRNCDDGLELKARMARRFKKIMEEAKLYIQQGNGDVRMQLDPRGGLQIPPNRPQVFAPPRDEAEYLKECVKELKEKRNADGSPFIDASVADHIDDIEKLWLPLWLAEKTDTKPSEKTREPAAA